MGSNGALSLSVIMPAYNEEESIADAVRDVQRHVLTVEPEAELIVVNDGSRDKTGRILDELATQEPRLIPIHQNNGGHGDALRTGLEAARGEYLLLLDSDRQIPLESFPMLWEAARCRDGAFGVRAKRHDPRHRLILSGCMRRVIRVLFGVRLRDPNIPCKIIRREVWFAARDLIPEGTLCPSLFLAIFMRKRNCSLVEINVPHIERCTGIVSVRRWRLLRFCLAAFRQLLAFRRRMH